MPAISSLAAPCSLPYRVGLSLNPTQARDDLGESGVPPAPAGDAKEGAQRSNAAIERGARWAFWAFIALFTLTGLDHPFGNGDEVRHAQTLKEMMASGDVFTMRWQGVPSFTRPATQYWLGAVGAFFIDGEAGMRVSSAAASLLTLAIVGLLARRMFGRFDVLVLAVVLCAGAASYRHYSRSVMSEPFLVAALMIALYGTIHAQRDPKGLRIAFAALGGAVAIKSFGAAPSAVLLLPWLIRGYRKTRGHREALLGLGLALALALPFYGIGVALHGTDFLQEHFGFNVVGRALGQINVSVYPWDLYLWHFQHRDGLPTYAWLALGMVFGLVMAIRRRDLELAIVSSFALGNLVIMSSLGTRLPHYVLAVYPTAALGCAGLYHHLTWPRAARWSPVYRALAPALALFLLVINLRMVGANQVLMQTAAAKVLGTAAKQAAGPEERVYAYEWYGQGLSFYADRDLVLLTTLPKRFAQIDVAHFKRANAAKLVPPLPEPPGSRILVAAYRADLLRARWLVVEEPLAESEQVFLVRARVVDPAAR